MNMNININYMRTTVSCKNPRIIIGIGLVSNYNMSLKLLQYSLDEKYTQIPFIFENFYFGQSITYVYRISYHDSIILQNMDKNMYNKP